MQKLTKLYDEEGNEYDITPDLSDYITQHQLDEEVSIVGKTGLISDLVNSQIEIIFDCNQDLNV